MIRLLFLIPVVLCLLWMIYLTANGHRIRDGKQGFVYILVVSAVIAAFYTLMWWVA